MHVCLPLIECTFGVIEVGHDAEIFPFVPHTTCLVVVRVGICLVKIPVEGHILYAVTMEVVIMSVRSIIFLPNEPPPSL